MTVALAGKLLYFAVTTKSNLTTTCLMHNCFAQIWSCCPVNWVAAAMSLIQRRLKVLKPVVVICRLKPRNCKLKETPVRKKLVRLKPKVMTLNHYWHR